MFKSKIKKILLLGILLLSGCQANTKTEINSLKDGLLFLNTSKNYTLEIESSTYGTCSYIYTKNSIGFTASRKSSAMFAYIKDSKGIYPLNYDNGYVAGEYLLDEASKKITNLWGGEVFKTLLGVETSYIKGLSNDITTLTVTNKNYKMAFIQSIGYDINSYVNVDSLVINYVDDVLTFSLKMSNNKSAETYTLTNINTSKNEEVDNFLKNGGKALTLSSSLLRVRNLIKSNNFLRYIYDMGSHEYTGIEIFNPHYFYSEITSSNYGSGAMAMNQKANEYHSVDLYGCYNFVVNTSIVKADASNIGFYSMVMYEKPDIVEFYHYPTYLQILSSMQYLKTGEVDGSPYQYEGESYYFDQTSLVYDFVSNFSIDQSFDVNEYIPYAIGIDFINNDADKDCYVTFIYYFTYGNTLYAMPIPLTNFNNSNVALLDAIYDAYND
ncbi:MAG: hypothetical protein ACI31G_00995 [Bacilli bacterium]